MAGEGTRVGTKSVLFTDLVDSTQLRVRLGDDGADTLRRVHDVLIAEAVVANGGTVVKGLGDGVMASFDSAANAVAGAIAVQQAAELHGRRGPEQALAIRVGISIGDVSTEDGDVFGVPVVEAARLCAMAGSGEILAADVVRALARGRENFVFEPMGTVTLKGLPDPVDACRVVWEPVLEAPPDSGGTQVPISAALAGAATPYVGREPLREHIDGAWREVRAGSCRTVLLAGEPGVGKTRTAAEAARSAFSDGALVLYGRCDEDLGVPYQPFVEALEHYVRHSANPALGRWSGELVRLVPDLATQIAALPAPVASDPASEEYRLYEAVASCLLDAARSDYAGLVLVLDDLHWATKPTLRLLEHVVRSATQEAAPLLVLATYRDTDIDRMHPLSAVLADLRRLPGIERLPVLNLDSDEVLTFIELAAGHELDGPTRELAAAIYDETEGNPFFIGEVLRHLIETGGVQRSGDRWIVAEPDTVTVPEGVRDVVGRRLSRLSATADAVLSVASVIGRDFDLEVLLAVVDLPEDDVLDALDLAARARLVTETGVDRYRFAHALVRTTLYGELSATRRRRVHRRVTDVLEKVRPDDVRALAHHSTQAGGDGDLARAVRYTLAAAEQSLAARAFADAESGFRTALDLLSDAAVPTPREKVAALCGLGEAQRDQGDAGFRETLFVASESAIELGDLALLTRTVLANSRGYASIVGAVDWQRLTYIEKAVELTGTARTADRARLLAQLASELTFSGEHGRRLQVSDEAERIARSLGDPVLVGEVIAATAYARSAGADWEHLLVRTDEGVRLADLGGDPTRRVVARVFSSSALLTAGRLEESERELRTAIELADTAAPPVMQWTASSNKPRLSALAGRLDEAEAQNAASLEFANRLGQPDGAQWWAATQLGIMWLRGRTDDFADAAAVFAEQYPLARTWRTAYAWILAEAGRIDEARLVIDEYALASGDLLIEAWPFVPAFQLALATWQTGDVALAAELAELLAPYRTCWSHYFLLVMGPMTWPLGLMHAVTGAHDAAVADLEEALTAVTRRSFPAYAARIGLNLGEVLLRRGAAGDRERSAAVLARARADAVAVGASGIVARIDAVA
jgi:class 3 adenylate cyclase/DNA polymerase III delta prime subunit